MRSTNRGRHAADQLATTFRRTSLDRNSDAIDGQRIVAGSDLVDTVRFAARVDQRAGDFVTHAGDRLAADVVVGRAADDGAAVVGHGPTVMIFKDIYSPVRSVMLVRTSQPS